MKTLSSIRSVLANYLHLTRLGKRSSKGSWPPAMYCYMPVGPYITDIIVTCLWSMISQGNKPCIRIRYTTGSYINTYTFIFWVPTVSLLCFKLLWNSQFCSCCRGNCKELLAVKKVDHIFFFLSMNELSFPLLLLFEILILSPSSWRKKINKYWNILMKSSYENGNSIWEKDASI